MKLPELPDLNGENDNKKNNSKSSTSFELPSLDGVDEVGSQGFSDNAGVGSDSQENFEDSIEMPDLISIDDELNPKDEYSDKEGFGDIPIGKDDEVKLEPNRMFEDLPINAEFEEPQLFGDIPIEGKANSNENVSGVSEISSDMPPISFDIEDDKEKGSVPSEGSNKPVEEVIKSKMIDLDKSEVQENANEIKGDLEEELEKELETYRGNDSLPKMPNIGKEESEDDEDYTHSESIFDEDESLYVEDVEDEDIEEEFGFLPGVDLDEDIEDEDIEEEFGFLPGVDSEEDLEEEYPSDEEKIKEFFANLKAKITSPFSKLSKEDKSDELLNKPESKPKKTKKDGKINSNDSNIKNIIISSMKYVAIIAIFLMVIFFTVSKLGLVGGYSNLEEITQVEKINKVKIELSDVQISENKLSLSINNDTEEFLDFTLAAEVMIKNESGKQEFSCNDTIMFISSEETIEENINCEGLPEHKEGNTYKIKFNSDEL